MFYKTRFFRIKILDDEKEQNDKSLCKKKKKENNTDLLIVQMRIHLDITSLLNPIFAIISKRNLFAQLFYRDDICIRYRESERNRAIGREHGKYTWVKSLFAPGPPSFPTIINHKRSVKGERMRF